MKTRIEARVYVDVYDTTADMLPETADRWARHALLHGDKHSDQHHAFLGEVVAVTSVENDD
ncbi:hypothetical protein NPS70_16305 [Streptomyces sp. C10-9-1]|uniref:hypothetical protein n=1 Tax=Streptomyces sp. C10-9-1 TaxID=1859285 RepID=UPI002111009D|nr:hypothetical protein [Streptomyces sp. C10-9-1]MCQ6554748.1 hypothetical protein [Streptomyces sp. C10-9-1]